MLPGARPIGKFNHVAIRVIDKERMPLWIELDAPGRRKASRAQAFLDCLKPTLGNQKRQMHVRAAPRAVKAHSRAARLRTPQAKIGAWRRFHPDGRAFR